jgi:hypothetical protein
VAKSVLADRIHIDRLALTGLVKSGIAGDDLIVLTALASRRAGGDTWDTFRAESSDLLAAAPLHGSVSVFVNRLANSKLPLVAIK